MNDETLGVDSVNKYVNKYDNEYELNKLNNFFFYDNSDLWETWCHDLYFNLVFYCAFGFGNDFEKITKNQNWKNEKQFKKMMMFKKIECLLILPPIEPYTKNIAL